MAAKEIAVIVGSLRKASLNRKMAQALDEIAGDRLNLRIVEIGDLPLYNEDLETDAPPAAWTRFRDEVRPADGLLFVTPEYNRSMSGAIKNAIDVGSRPYGHGVLVGKPAAVVSVSQGAIGGFGANHHLRQSLVFLDAPVLQQPEMYISNAGKLFGEEGVADSLRPLLEKFVDAFAAWVDRHPAGQA